MTDKLEKDLIETKKEKMLQDNLDYDTNAVYVWKRQRNWGRKTGKHVIFSDTEVDYVTSDSDHYAAHASGSGWVGGYNTLNSSKNGVQKRKPHKKQHNKGTKKQEGDQKVDEDEGGNQYPLWTFHRT